MKKSLIYFAVAGIAIVLFNYGCQSPSQQNQEDNTGLTDSLTSEQLEYLVPSPGEVFGMVEDLGLTFNMAIVSPLKNVSEFPLYRSQALNFGAYLTDFSYLLVFEKQSESIKYLYQIQDMSVLLGVTEFFDDEFFNSLLANLNHPDSLKGLALNQTALFFNKMERLGNNELALLVSTGAMIEAIYLSSQIINEASIDDNTISAISNLAILFDSFFLHYTATNSIDNQNVELTNDLTEIRNIFTSMTIVQTSNSIRKEGKIIISNETQSEISSKNIKTFKTMIGKVRDKIVNQEY